MRGTSHILIGIAIGSVLANHTGAPLVGIGACAFGALTPDIDMPGSTLGRWVPWPSVHGPTNGRGFTPKGRRGLRGPIWHRGQLHSVGFVLLLTILLTLAYRAVAHAVPVPGILETKYLLLFAVALGVGGLSHLVVDSINISPMMAAWPISHKMMTLPIPHAPQNSLRGRAYELFVVAVVLAVAFWLIGGATGLSQMLLP